MDALASFSRSRGVATFEPPGRTSPLYGWHRTVKHYQRGQHSRMRPSAAGPGSAAARWETARAMELHEAIRRRAWSGASPPSPWTAASSTRSSKRPCARPPPGNTAGTAWVVLRDRRRPRSTSTPRPTPRGGRATPSGRRGSAGAGRAPGLRLPRGLRRPLRRTGQGSLGSRRRHATAWPVPYWFGDAAFGVMAVLLAAVDAGLGACVLGAFRGEDDWPRCSGSLTAGASSAPLPSASPTATTTGRHRWNDHGRHRPSASTGGAGQQGVALTSRALAGACTC